VSVLILSSPNDVHSKAVAHHLAQFGLEITYWRPQNLLTESLFTFALNEDGFDCQLAADGKERLNTQISLAAIESFWLRRPGSVKSRRMPEGWIESLVEHESSRALEAIFRLLPALWVNHPASQQEAMLKVRQLEVARQCGLAIPDTIVTNDPKQVAEFYKRHNSEIIYKLIDSRSGRCFPLFELPRSIPTLPVRQIDLNYLDQVGSCLHLFQKRIAKKSDLRVTIVGQKVFAAEIESQEQEELLDWRLKKDLPIKPFQLPNEIEQSCLLLIQKLGLNFAALDFCRTFQGELVFLEANPDGQFLWIEEALELPISLALAKLLAGQDEPLA